MFSGHFSLQLVDLRMDHQVNRFMGCDYNVDILCRPTKACGRRRTASAALPLVAVLDASRWAKEVVRN